MKKLITLICLIIIIFCLSSCNGTTIQFNDISRYDEIWDLPLCNIGYNQIFPKSINNKTVTYFYCYNHLDTVLGEDTSIEFTIQYDSSEFENEVNRIEQHCFWPENIEQNYFDKPSYIETWCSSSYQSEFAYALTDTENLEITYVYFKLDGGYEDVKIRKENQPKNLGPDMIDIYFGPFFEAE